MAKIVFNDGRAVAPFMEGLVAARDNAMDSGQDGALRVPAIAGVYESMTEACEDFQSGQRGEPFPSPFVVPIRSADVKEARSVLETLLDEARTAGFDAESGSRKRRDDFAGKEIDGAYIQDHVLPGEVGIEVDDAELALDALDLALQAIRDALGQTDPYIGRELAASTWGDAIKSRLRRYIRSEREFMAPFDGCPPQARPNPQD